MNPSTLESSDESVGPKTSLGINQYIASHQELSREELAIICGVTPNAVDHRERAMGIKRKKVVAPKGEEGLSALREKSTLKDQISKGGRQLKEAVEYIEQLENEREALFSIKKTIQTFDIGKRAVGSGKSEATAFMVASDWHIEEPVVGAEVNDLNEYNLEISKARAVKFFQNGLRLIQIFQKDTKIKQLVLPLLGDFFSNSIHEELAESNLLLPGDAAWRAQQYLVSGIEFLLKNSDLDLMIVGHSGNHGRMTKKVHISTEEGNSLETYMYKNMAQHFAGERRVKFIVAEGMMTYITLYGGFTVRFLHGHAIKFGGGVGGITIPVRKAIMQWDKARRANLTVFGHFHQMFDGGDFIANGSLIGYNRFALAIKADYERPRQAFFLISNYKNGEKSMVAPIRVD